MLSRIFWVGIAGIALVTGMILQDGDRMLSWSGVDEEMSVSTERAIAAGIERAIDRGVDRMEVVGADGREIDVPPETRRAFADSVGRLVKAETNLAMLKVRDASEREIRAAGARRDKARAEVDALKAKIDPDDQESQTDRDAVREQIREDIRETVRDAVGR